MPKDDNKKMVYVQGRLKPHNKMKWVILGIWENEDDAIAACETTRDFVGFVPLNEKLSDRVALWPGVKFLLSAAEVAS